jgi:hypothetical protein
VMEAPNAGIGKRRPFPTAAPANPRRFDRRAFPRTEICPNNQRLWSRRATIP